MTLEEQMQTLAKASTEAIKVLNSRLEALEALKQQKPELLKKEKSKLSELSPEQIEETTKRVVADLMR